MGGFPRRPPSETSPPPPPLCARAIGGLEGALPPTLRRKEMVPQRAPGAALRVLIARSPRNRALCSGAPRGAAAPGGEGRSPATLSSPDCLLRRCGLRSRKEPLEGDPSMPAPGVRSAGRPALWRGSPGKAPLPRSVPPRHKSGRRKRGERAFVNSNVRRPTPGGRFVNNLPFLVARAGGVAPPPMQIGRFPRSL